MRFELPRKVDLRVLAVGALLMTAGLLLVVKVYQVWPRIIELGLYVGCLLLLAAHKPLRQMLQSLPRPQLRFLLCLVAVMMVTQLYSRPQKTFPFVPWAMYTSRLPSPPRYYEYVGICDDGREVLIPAASVFRSQHRTVPWRLHARWRLMHSLPDEKQREVLRQRYLTLLTAMVERYNQQYPESAVQRVRVIECNMPRPAPGRKLEVTRQPLREFTIR